MVYFNRQGGSNASVYTGRIELLEDLPNDTKIYVPSIEVAGDLLPALYVDVCDDGSDGGIAEVNIVGDEE